MRGFHGYSDWLQGEPYVLPVNSYSYLLPYNFGIPALVMGFVGVTLMTMQRILAVGRKHQLRAEHLATRDDLTNLLNRRAFRTVAERDLARALRQGHSLCLAMIDLDHFKRLNDNHGHSSVTGPCGTSPRSGRGSCVKPMCWRATAARSLCSCFRIHRRRRHGCCLIARDWR